MTVIEFFARDAIENMVSTLLCDPDRVIFIGYSRKAMEKAIAQYIPVARRHGKKAEFTCRSVARNNLQQIVALLREVTSGCDDCTVDLSGGEELYLVAAGIASHCSGGRVQLHKFNIRRGILYDCGADGNVLRQGQLRLTVEDQIRLYNGTVLYATEQTDGTRLWDYTDGFIRDAETMWELCRKDTRQWNRLISLLRNPDPEKPESLALAADRRRCGGEIPALFTELAEAGMISRPVLEGKSIVFTCKNSQVKGCLSAAGQILELYTTLALRSLGFTREGEVLTGVSIDWNGQKKHDVENEIDVLFMNGLVPVFISCKNGFVDADELYKLSIVAVRFGGKYAKKALVVSGRLNRNMFDRAREMGIRIIDNVRAKDTKTFLQALRKLAEL